MPLNLITIDSRDDPRIADYRDLKDAQLRALAKGDGAAGYPNTAPFIAEGELVVRQLLLSGLPVRSILITPTRLATLEPALANLPPATPVYLAPQELMNGVVGFPIHRGVVASAHRPAQRDLSTLLRSVSTAVVLEDLANHDNVGGIFRATAALAGLSHAAVLYSPRTCDPFYRKAIRVSIGTVLRLPSAPLDPWPGSLQLLKTAGFTLIALTPDPAARGITDLPPVPRPALLLGAEGPGLSPQAMAAADHRIRIPLAPEVDSLNVVTAAAIALHRLCGPIPPTH